MLDDPGIDAVYNPLPNHLHVPWSIKALKAGKHVLCEKPIALTAEEGQELVDAAKAHPELKVMEAFMYRHHPQWQYAWRAVQGGQVGDLRTIQTFFSYYNDDPQNIRNMADIGGGGLMDIGCYAISLSRFLFDTEPLKVSGLVEYDPNFKTDRLASAMMVFESGTSTFTCSTLVAPYQRVLIVGTTGWVEIEIPFNAPPDKPCRLWHHRAGETKEVKFDVVDQYTIQGDLFSQAVLDDSPVPTPIEDAVANMKVIEALFESDKLKSWVDLSR
jgi:predicted dehydrogenase